MKISTKTNVTPSIDRADWSVLLTIQLLVLGLFSCQPEQPQAPPVDRLFTTMPATYTGIDFVNQLDFQQDFNIYTYRNFYNGGGVAIGDVNNDGLPDIYFTANMKPNRLYLNKGQFRFEDVTEKAGVGGTRKWSTGVAMADVNGDGWLDIYVCNSGDVAGDNRQNELYINQLGNGGDPTMPVFKEEAEKYGLADAGLSTHAAFFDYDKDGDLDCYLLNNSYRAIGSFNLKENERPVRDSVGGDKLFRNDNGRFVDVSAAAGIYGSVIGFGLGVTVGDIDQDGWPDIYVSNDFFERDYIYMNNGDGTFRETLESQMRSISGASMGADMADITGDGFPEIFVTEMLPEPEHRLKTKTTFENWDRYQYGVKNGYYHQFTRNMLHLNNADGTFSEIGRLADIEATDWSWGALFTDLNNDGYPDIFVANGIHQDLTDQDFLNFIASDETKRAIVNREGVDFKKLIEFIPSEKIPNYAFAGNGSLRFANKAAEWGLAEPSHSNGAAYGDLDNDGDLDLVVNNCNMPAFIYRNEADTLLKNNWLSLQLKGTGKNPFAIGAKVRLVAGDRRMYREHIPMRGFESSMDYRLHFGLGNIPVVDSLIVDWNNGRQTLLTGVGVNQQLTIEMDQATASVAAVSSPVVTLFKDVSANFPLDFRHTENIFVDFDRDHLLYHKLSTEGPKICRGDVNGDNLEDVFIGGAKDMAGRLFLQLPSGKFQPSSETVFAKDQTSEDLDCLFFDADNDGDLDLYVCSGGHELPTTSAALQDRLYLNDGRGNFSRKEDQVLPAGRFESSSTVDAADFDQDGDLDLIVGVRVRPKLYGVPCNGYILQNDGKGHFTNVTEQVAPGLLEVGMITDARWVDVDGDGDLDLVVVGEWMPVTVFTNENGRFEKRAVPLTSGWYNSLAVADTDGDGDPDLIAGNHGLNSRFKASAEQPVSCYVNDFDANGTAEQIVCTFNGDQSYPLVLRQDLVRQLPELKKKYLKFESYQYQTITDIFTPEQLEKAIVHEVVRLESIMLINDGQGHFEVKALPDEAQFAPVYAIQVHDFDRDGHQDILLGGNLYGAKPEVGRYDASYGLWLKGDGQNNFRPAPAIRSGIRFDGEVRDFEVLTWKGRSVVLVARNNEVLQVFEF